MIMRATFHVPRLTIYSTLFAIIANNAAAAEWTRQAARFLTLQDAAVRYALAGAILLGLGCGLLGG